MRNWLYFVTTFSTTFVTTFIRQTPISIRNELTRLNRSHQKMHLRRHQNLQKEKPSTLCGLMAFIIFLIHLVLVQTVNASSCDILFPKEDGLTIVRTINQGSDLNKFLSGIHIIKF